MLIFKNLTINILYRNTRNILTISITNELPIKTKEASTKDNRNTNAILFMSYFIGMAFLD